MIGEEGCAQCGGLGTIEVSRARSKRTADALCKCVFLVLMGEIAALGRELAERDSSLERELAELRRELADLGRSPTQDPTPSA